MDLSLSIGDEVKHKQGGKSFFVARIHSESVQCIRWDGLQKKTFSADFQINEVVKV